MNRAILSAEVAPSITEPVHELKDTWNAPFFFEDNRHAFLVSSTSSSWYLWEAVGFGIILKAIQSHGNPAVQLPQGPSFFRFSDPAECDRTLREAGFLNVRVTSVRQVWRFDAPDELFDAIFNGGVRIKAILRAQSSEALEAIRTAARESAKNFTHHGVIKLPMPAILASAVKPT